MMYSFLSRSVPHKKYACSTSHTVNYSRTHLWKTAHPNGNIYQYVVSQNRWSLLTSSITLKYRSFCQECVTFSRETVCHCSGLSRQVSLYHIVTLTCFLAQCSHLPCLGSLLQLPIPLRCGSCPAAPRVARETSDPLLPPAVAYPTRANRDCIYSSIMFIFRTIR